MIRKARLEDIDSLMPLFRIAHKNTIFKDTRMDEKHIRRMLAIGVSMPNFFCEVVEHEGKVVGILGGAIDKTVWGSLVATDIIFISRRNTDVLLKHFLKWADDMCAEMVQITNLADNKRYERLLAGLDFKQAGQVFIKEV